MIDDRIEQQIHGYRNGHQLLSASLRLSRDDQDVVDRLSDMAGPLRPGEAFLPYLTTYPVPSRTFYVVARTWQDLRAPRAGCVLTRSLLVPMIMWESIENIADLLVPLIPIEPGAIAESSLRINSSSQLPIVEDARITEIVEALFLEIRQPIVIFDAPEAEAMLIRLLTAQWPNLRRTFAACTFTLAPRKIDGREFDLLFAPKSARTRFADWPGRKIDVGSDKPPRHRWSEATANQIFNSSHPSLTATDDLGLLKGFSGGDESALRLSLLWNELSSKAETTPTAVLGLLDILNTQPDLDPEVFGRLSPLIEKAVVKSNRESEPEDAWVFLIALFRKFSFWIPSKKVLRAIRKSVRELIGRDPEAAFVFLEEESKASRRVPQLLLKGLADGLSRSQDMFPLSFLERLPLDVALTLIALSAAFARSTIRGLKRAPEEKIDKFLLHFDRCDQELQKSVRRRLAPLLDDDLLAPLLPPLLVGVDGQELKSLVVRIGRGTGFQSGALDSYILDAAKTSNSVNDLREAVGGFQTIGADRLLLGMLELNSLDVAWVCGGTLDELRTCRILFHLLERETDRRVQAIIRDTDTRDKILHSLIKDSAHTGSQIARILIFANVNPEAELDIGYGLLSLIPDADGDRLATHLLKRSLMGGSLGDERIKQLVSRAGTLIEFRQLVQYSASKPATAERVGENIIILNGAPEPVRRGVLSQIDELSKSIVRYGRGNLGEEAYATWAAMLQEANHVEHEAHLRAAVTALNFAFNMITLPVSAIVVVAFPVVYSQLTKSRDADLRGIPALFTLPLRFLVDWDGTKSARNNLVDAFLKSSWPPVDLLRSSIKANIPNAILELLVAKYGGEKYLDAIRREVEGLSESERLRLEAVLSNFRSVRQKRS